MSNENDIIVKLVHLDEEYAAAMSVRRQVFVEEIGIPENREFDGNDHCAVHIIAYSKKSGNIKPIGTMRIRSFAGFVEFERMAVIKDYRKSNVSDAIMQYGFNYVSEKGYSFVCGRCKKELLPRWQECGYQRIPGSKPFEQNGMVLLPIYRVLPENPRAVKMKSPQEILTALEGHWFDEKTNKEHRFSQSAFQDVQNLHI